VAEKDLQKQPARRGPGKRFEPGQSGNPSGRKAGSVNRITQAAQELLNGEAKALTRKAVELALVSRPRN